MPPAVLEDALGSLLGVIRKSRAVQKFWETTESHNLQDNDCKNNKKSVKGRDLELMINRVTSVTLCRQL